MTERPRNPVSQRLPLLLAVAAPLALGAQAKAQSLGEGSAGGMGSSFGSGSGLGTGGAGTPVNAPFAGTGYGVVPGGAPSGMSESPVRLGGFFAYPYGQPMLPRAGTGPGRSLEFQPALQGQVMATDNARGGRDRQGDIVTTITPDMLLLADTARLQGSVRYAPRLQYYANGTDDTRLTHTGTGTMLVTLVPGTMFLDLRGSAAVVPTSGGRTDVGEETLNRSNSSQTSSFSATPYYMHRFGSLATALVGYTYQYGQQGGSSRTLELGGPTVYQPSEFSGHTGFAALRSGEDFGRVAMELRGSATSYTGDGVLDGASRSLAILETRYAFTRSVIGIGEVGYEEQDYSNAIPPFHISEPVWGIGVRLEPSPNTSLTARYQRRDGANSPSLEARIGLGPRTVLFANYSDKLATLAQQDADLLSTTLIDEYGNAIDSRTGAPTRPVTGNSSLGLQSGLLRTRRLNVTLSQRWERDVVSLNGDREERIPVADAPGSISLAQKSSTLGVSWSHALTDQTSTVASARYGWVENGVQGGGTEEGTLYSLRVSLAHQFTQTLQGSVQYLVTNRSTEYSATGSGFGSGENVQNAIIATLRKNF